jgi:membrane-bound ClpP family serine protease
LPGIITTGYVLLNPLRHSLRTDAVVVLVLAALQLTLWVWAVVGITRSANRHTSRGGKLFWANTARVMMCISVIGMAVRFERSLIPQTRLMASIAAGHDPLDSASVEVSPDGRTITFDGTFGEGAVDELQKVMDASPNATTLVLNSDGGRQSAAEELARRVRQRHLDTLVQDHCLSACTFIFLAGNKREIADDADLGFHQATVEGISALGKTLALAQMAEYYRSHGVRESFIDHIVSTPPESMWYPTQDELKEGGVLN